MIKKYFVVCHYKTLSGESKQVVNTIQVNLDETCFWTLANKMANEDARSEPWEVDDLTSYIGTFNNIN